MADLSLCLVGNANRVWFSGPISRIPLKCKSPRIGEGFSSVWVWALDDYLVTNYTMAYLGYPMCCPLLFGHGRAGNQGVESFNLMCYLVHRVLLKNIRSDNSIS